MRLDKFLRARGISRRQTRELAAAGRILLNGVPAVSAAEDCEEDSLVQIDGQTVGPAQPLYLMLHKPPGVVTAVRDPERTVMDLPKTYWIRVGRPFPPDAEQKFQEGIRFPNGTLCRPAQITIAPDRQSATVTITEGKTHQVRRMAAACGVRVQILRRLSIGGLSMEKTLEPGQCRELTGAELEQLFSETE